MDSFWISLFASFYTSKITSYENNVNLKNVANSLIKKSSLTNYVKKEPSSLVKVINRFEYIFCFDILNEKNLIKLIPQKTLFKKFFYISKYAIQVQDNLLLKKKLITKLIYTKDLNIYELKNEKVEK